MASYTLVFSRQKHNTDAGFVNQGTELMFTTLFCPVVWYFYAQETGLEPSTDESLK